MAWNLIAGTIGQGAGSTLSTIAAQRQANKQNRKYKNAMADYPYTPYAGERPPDIDVNGTDYLRGTQKQIQDIVSKRAAGEGVGYSPEWLSSSQALIKSNLDRALEDRTRTTAGSLSAAGLSGNLRAQEAMTGRAQRDYSTDLGNSMSQLTIADMERKNQERDVNTARLQDLNTFNFGQENTGSIFDQNTWKMEEAAKEARTAQALDAADRFRDPYSVGMATMGSGLSNWGSGMTSMGMGGGEEQAPAVQTYGSSPTMSEGSGGYGLAPSSYSAQALSSSPTQQYMNWQDSEAAKKRGVKLGA